MTSAVIEQRLRRFLLLVAGSICIGTIVELLLTDHLGDPVQFLPFILCTLGLIVVVAVLLRPQRRTLLALRGVMAVVALGSGFGIFEHLEHNVDFALEIRPTATFNEVWLEALRGANPLLAPGILALAAILAVAATYYHPALSKQTYTEEQGQVTIT